MATKKEESKKTIMIAEIHEWRQILYANTILIDDLKKTRETSIAYTKLQECRMWLGKSLSFLENKNPYPESKNSENEIIEKEADVTSNTDSFIKEWKSLSEIKKVKLLRNDFDNLANTMLNINKNKIADFDGIEKFNACIVLSLKYIHESIMWLGQYLKQINLKTVKNEQK